VYLSSLIGEFYVFLRCMFLLKIPPFSGSMDLGF